jgi:hypothetical protein
MYSCNVYKTCAGECKNITQGPCLQQRLYYSISHRRSVRWDLLTIHAGVVRLHVGRFDLAVLDDQGISFASRLTKYCSGIELQIKRSRECSVWIR